MTRAIVDRLGNASAVLIAGGVAFELPRSLLPDDVAEGDTVLVDVRRDAEATEAARKATAHRRRRLARDDDGGDFSL